MRENGFDTSGGGPRDVAIEWWLRRANRPLSAAEQADFEAWLAADEAHRRAFADIADMCGHLAALAPARASRRQRGETAGHGARRRLSGAAALVAAAAIALFLVFDDLALTLRADHRTGTGETARVTLEDGSHVELDARSAISVRYAAGERRLRLLAGEAWFEVAPDASRPFVVEAGGGEITALGTAFDVALDGERARVAVTEHQVSVASGGRRVTVEENQESGYARGAAARPPEPSNIERVTAWRRGRLMFENRPLGEVIAALARYHHGWIYFVRPELRQRRVTGIFGADDPLSALEEIELSLGLHAVQLTNYLIFIYD